jgi:UDP-glucose-4-epimerase GalE
MKRVIVTGAAGYIGGQTLLMLQDLGWPTLAVDTRALHPGLHHESTQAVRGDFADQSSLRAMIEFSPDAIVHCAGTSLVGPSLRDPAVYFNNNTAKTLLLLDTLRRSFPRLEWIFSSSAACYGEPVSQPCRETDACRPISPYGHSKLMIENIMETYYHAYGLRYVALRYFNACGADARARHGQEPGATHIIARVLESIRDDTAFTLNGNNFDTPDGTCVRDYVHVMDIVRAHILSIDNQVLPSGVYNLGTSRGYSNLDVIRAAERITGRRLRYSIGDPRVGDPAQLTASPERFGTVTQWTANYGLDDMITHAWRWCNK